MKKNIFVFILAALTAVFVTIASAQEKKQDVSPKPAQSPSQELLRVWNGLGKKLIAMAEDFPEDKYDFRAQKDERTFGENLLHVASDYNEIMNALKGSEVGYTGNGDSLRKKYPSKADIVTFLKQSVANGTELITAQGDTGLTREFISPWGNKMVHGSFAWMGAIEHAGEHYGQLVVYYRLNGLVPPASRPKK
jgi:hypothetical protein